MPDKYQLHFVADRWYQLEFLVNKSFYLTF